MHQNKFHTETIQRLTMKYDDSKNGGPPLNEDEVVLANHLKILYKFANKGIKGRGKKDERRKGSDTSEKSSLESLDRENTRGFGEQTLLPLPVSKPPVLRGIEGSSPFMLNSGTWREDVFTGQGQQSNFIGIPGDSHSGVLGGYGFGNLG
jgi:hypothetical protein